MMTLKATFVVRGGKLNLVMERGSNYNGAEDSTPEERKLVDKLQTVIENRYRRFKLMHLKPEEHVLATRPPTDDEVYAGKAEWCGACGNRDCAWTGRDVLTMCNVFTKKAVCHGE